MPQAMEYLKTVKRLASGWEKKKIASSGGPSGASSISFPAEVPAEKRETWLRRLACEFPHFLPLQKYEFVNVSNNFYVL